MSRPSGTRSLIALLLMTAFSAAPALGTSFYLRPFPQTVQRTELIARGTIGASHTRWAPLGATERIFTYTELEVTEVLKGSVGDVRNVIVRDLGGEKDGVAMDVGGAAKFRQGEDVVLMLKGPNPDGSYDVRGMMMGKLEVQVDEKGDEILSGPALGRPGIVNDETGHNDTEESQEYGGKWTLERLRELIRLQGAAPDSAQKPVKKEETSKTKVPAEGSGGQAPALQPEKTEGLPEPGKDQQGTLDSPRRISPRFIAFALAAVILLGAVLAYFFRGKRG